MYMQRTTSGTAGNGLSTIIKYLYAARSFTLIFSVPVGQANLVASSGSGGAGDASVASRVAGDQQVNATHGRAWHKDIHAHVG
jgi:cytidylate kinase